MFEKAARSKRDRDNLFHILGKAIWSLQYVEDFLSKCVLIRQDFAARELGTVDPKEAFAALEKKQKLTLGQLIKIAETESLYPSEFVERLRQCKDERNWLTHWVVREQGAAFHDVNRGALLFQRIDNAIKMAEEINNFLVDDLMDHVTSKGVSKDDIYTKAGITLAEAGKF